jgi:hypothetical protein
MMHDLVKDKSLYTLGHSNLVQAKVKKIIGEDLELIDFMYHEDTQYLRLRNYQGRDLSIPSTFDLLGDHSFTLALLDDSLYIHCLESHYQQQQSLPPTDSQDYIMTYRDIGRYEKRQVNNDGDEEEGSIKGVVKFKAYEMKCLRMVLT